MSKSMNGLRRKYVKTSRGLFCMYTEFKSRQDAERAGYSYYFTENGDDIYIHHFDSSNIYRVHFAMLMPS